MKGRLDSFFFHGCHSGARAREAANKMLVEFISSPLRMATSILFESLGKWRAARGRSLEVGAVCFMRGKYPWTHRAPHHKGMKKRGPSTESGDSRSCQECKCDSEMHRLCDVMLRMAQRVLSEHWKSCGGWHRDVCPCLAEEPSIKGSSGKKKRISSNILLASVVRAS